ncbi:hypothetical protein LXL04_039779 [Taraxacum kok-saghyz]
MCSKSKRLTMGKDRGHKQQEIDISNLPDCILHHILSLMPTKEAVKTSILSTRWKNLWAFLPTIVLDDGLLMAKKVEDATSFVNFVERVLHLRGASNMEKLNLSCRVFQDALKIRSWISDAIMHNVQELDLSLFANNPSMIPKSIFDNTSLVSLKIRMNCAIELPSHVSFPCLKTLHLFFVWFQNDDFTEKLFSGCPVLEELVLFKNCFKNLKNFVITSSILKSLNIRDQTYFRVFEDVSGCKIKIDAPNLTYFEYLGYLSNEIILSNTSSLNKSYIQIPAPGDRIYEAANKAIDLLNQLQHVVSLTLSNHTLTTILFADNLRFAVFPNLTHLTLSMEIGMNHTFRVVMHFLSSCPMLQSICFSEGFMIGMHLGEKNSIWSSIPTCISNSLKKVTLKSFHGYTSEKCFLKRVLKNTCALEMMDIWWSEKYVGDLKRKTKVIKELEKHERKAIDSVIRKSKRLINHERKAENKTHGQHEIGDISDLVDHISSLPDCILHHILSFMPTKEAVKTSILSTRWKNENLWVFASKIDFDDDLLFSREVHGWHLPDVTSFVNLVERFY